VFSKRKQAPILGVDISSTAVKLIELSRSGGGFKVESHAVEPLPAEAVAEKVLQDVEAIGEALDELLEDEPYLGIDAAQRRRFEGDGDGGTRNGGKAGQLTRDDLKRMGPDEIEQARVDGKLTDLLGSS